MREGGREEMREGGTEGDGGEGSDGGHTCRLQKLQGSFVSHALTYLLQSVFSLPGSVSY